MPVDHSEFAIVKTLDKTTPLTGEKDWIIVESYQFNAGTDGKSYLLTSVQHSATDTAVVDQSGTEASSRLFVGNLTLDSQTSVQTGFGGSVVVASGDVNGDDNKPDVLVASSGREWTFDDGLLLPAVQTQPDANPQAPGEPITFTYTVTNTSPAGAVAGVIIAATSDNNRLDDDDPLVLVTDADLGAIAGVIIAATSDNNRDGSDYSGSHAMYQDVVIPQTLDTGSWLI